MKKALEAGRYQGGVRMGDTGIVLNTIRLAALVPLDRLTLVEDGRKAEWQGRRWIVSQVPQRCWDYDGRLVTENPMSDSPALISTEDVSGLSKNISRDGAPPAEVVFRPDNALEDPTHDIEAAIKEVQYRRKQSTGKGWREDGTWGPPDEASGT